VVDVRVEVKVAPEMTSVVVRLPSVPLKAVPSIRPVARKFAQASLCKS